MNRTRLSFPAADSRADTRALAFFAPPGPVRRWTGRAALTIPLPSLAALRLASVSAAPLHRSTPFLRS